MVTFEIFAKPALLRMSGRANPYRRQIKARLLDEFPAPPGLVQFVRVRLERDQAGEITARLTGPQGSGILSSLAQADGLMIIPENQSGGRPGDIYAVLPLDQGLYTNTFG
jgi:molybdopterin molybdotransferase